MLNSVFDKWWKEFKEELDRVTDLPKETLAHFNQKEENIRSEREVLDEVLLLLRERDELSSQRLSAALMHFQENSRYIMVSREKTLSSLTNELNKLIAAIEPFTKRELQKN